MNFADLYGLLFLPSLFRCQVQKLQSIIPVLYDCSHDGKMTREGAACHLGSGLILSVHCGVPLCFLGQHPAYSCQPLGAGLQGEYADQGVVMTQLNKQPAAQHECCQAHLADLRLQRGAVQAKGLGEAPVAAASEPLDALRAVLKAVGGKIQRCS